MASYESKGLPLPEKLLKNLNLFPNFMIWVQCAREPVEVPGSVFGPYKGPELLTSSGHILIDVWRDMKVIDCLFL